MNPVKKKIILFLIIFGIVILIFSVYFLFNQIKEESQNLILQKNRLAELEIRSESFKKIQETRNIYQLNLEKINKLFINLAEPINFIEFLEKEAEAVQLSIEITPFSQREAKEGSWPFMNFQLVFEGSFSNFLKFLERIESNSRFLIEVQNLNIRRITEKEKELAKGKGIEAILLIKVYSQ